MFRNPNHPERIGKTAAGLIAIALIVIAAYLSVERRFPWQGDYEIKAVVAQANELGPRSPVRIAGVEVGHVEDVRRGPGNTALVTMALKDEALPLHRDATVKIRPRIFLEGNFFVDLKPGTGSQPEMHEGDTIPLAQTSVPVQLDQVLTGLNTDTRDNLKILVHEYSVAMSHGGARALNRSFKPLAPALTNVALTTAATRGEAPHDLSSFIRFSAQTAAAASSSDRLGDLVTGLNRTVRALAERRAELGASVGELDSTLREASPALDALNRAFPPTRALVREIRPGLRAAPETLRLGNPLLLQLEPLVAAELPALLVDLDPAVRSLAHLEPRLRDTLNLVTPVTECLRRNAVPTLKKSVDDPPLSTGEPVYRELLYGLVGLSSASQNFDGNGPAVRYHAGFGDQTVTFGPAANTQGPMRALTSTPLIGSRPRYTGQRPPFRPDVPCVSQQPPNLAAVTGPAPQTSSVHARVRPLPPFKGLSYKRLVKALGVPLRGVNRAAAHPASRGLRALRLGGRTRASRLRVGAQTRAGGHR